MQALVCCICLCKDTNFKANHNDDNADITAPRVVYAYAKILILKQITTPLVKDLNELKVVYAYAKILILKQITTVAHQRRADIKLYMPMQRY